MEIKHNKIILSLFHNAQYINWSRQWESTAANVAKRQNVSPEKELSTASSLAKETQPKSVQTSESSWLFSRNMRDRICVEMHHKCAISKIQIVGNAIGLIVHVVQQVNYKEEWGMKIKRNLKIKKDLKDESIIF